MTWSCHVIRNESYLNSALSLSLSFSLCVCLSLSLTLTIGTCLLSYDVEKWDTLQGHESGAWLWSHTLELTVQGNMWEKSNLPDGCWTSAPCSFLENPNPLQLLSAKPTGGTSKLSVFPCKLTWFLSRFTAIFNILPEPEGEGIENVYGVRREEKNA